MNSENLKTVFFNARKILSCTVGTYSIYFLFHHILYFMSNFSILILILTRDFFGYRKFLFELEMQMASVISCQRVMYCQWLHGTYVEISATENASAVLVNYREGQPLLLYANSGWIATRLGDCWTSRTYRLQDNFAIDYIATRRWRRRRGRLRTRSLPSSLLHILRLPRDPWTS